MQLQATTGTLKDADVQAVAVAVFQGEKADDGILKELDDLTGGLVKSVIDSEEV